MQEKIEMKKIEIQKAMLEVVEKYFEEYTNPNANKVLTIDEIEEILGKSQKTLKTLLNEATSELIKYQEENLIEKKMFAPIAERN